MSIEPQKPHYEMPYWERHEIPKSAWKRQYEDDCLPDVIKKQKLESGGFTVRYAQIPKQLATNSKKNEKYKKVLEKTFEQLNEDHTSLYITLKEANKYFIPLDENGLSNCIDIIGNKSYFNESGITTAPFLKWQWDPCKHSYFIPKNTNLAFYTGYYCVRKQNKIFSSEQEKHLWYLHRPDPTHDPYVSNLLEHHKVTISCKTTNNFTRYITGTTTESEANLKYGVACLQDGPGHVSSQIYYFSAQPIYPYEELVVFMDRRFDIHGTTLPSIYRKEVEVSTTWDNETITSDEVEAETDNALKIRTEIEKTTNPIFSSKRCIFDEEINDRRIFRQLPSELTDGHLNIICRRVHHLMMQIDESLSSEKQQLLESVFSYLDREYPHTREVAKTNLNSSVSPNELIIGDTGDPNLCRGVFYIGKKILKKGMKIGEYFGKYEIYKESVNEPLLIPEKTTYSWELYVKTPADNEGPNVTVFINAKEIFNVLKFINGTINQLANLTPRRIKRKNGLQYLYGIEYIVKNEIHPNEQLLIDYTEDYWSQHKIFPLPIKPQDFIWNLQKCKVVDQRKHHLSEEV